MLSKILENNRNFTTTFIIVLFSLCMIFFTEYKFVDIKSQIPWLLVVISSILLIVPITQIAYFRNQFFPFFLMLLLFGFFRGEFKLDFYAAFLYFCMLQSQTLINIRYKKAIFNAFDLGFFTGFVILFYPPFVIFLMPMWLYYIFLGKIEYRLMLLNIIGLIVFVVSLFAVLITFEWWFIIDEITSKLKPNFVQFSKKDIILIPIGIVVIISMVDYLLNLTRHSVHKKLAYFTIFMYVIASIIYIFIWGGESSEKYLLLAYPFSLLLANYFTLNTKRKNKEAFAWIVVLCVMLYRFYNHFQMPDFLNNLTF